MPLSPISSSKSKLSFRGPLELEFSRAVDRSSKAFEAIRGSSSGAGHQNSPSNGSGGSTHLIERSPDIKKLSPTVPPDHPMPWELYERHGASPPPLPSPSHTIFTYSSSIGEGSTRPAYQRQVLSGTESSQPSGDFLHSGQPCDVSGTTQPTSPNSAGSSSVGSLMAPSSNGLSPVDLTSTPPSALRSPGSASGCSFLASLRPASPRIITPRDEGVTKRDREKSPSLVSDRTLTESQHGRVGRDTKTLEKARRPSSVFDHVGIVLERFKKAHHTRSESKEGRTSGFLSNGAGLFVEEQACLSSGDDRENTKDLVEFLDFPARQHPPPLSRKYSTSSVMSLSSHDDHAAASKKPMTRRLTLDRTLIQVTEDNERFAVVDVSGLNSAAGVKQKMLSKLHFFDEDANQCDVHRTEIGLAASNGPALTDESLLALCIDAGDDKGNLKFLIRQNGPAAQAPHSVPPPAASPRSNKGGLELETSAGVSPRISTAMAPQQLQRYSARIDHGKNSSISSLSSVSDALINADLSNVNSYDSGSETSRKAGVLSRTKVVKRSGGGHTSGDDSRQSSLASSGIPSRPNSTRPFARDRSVSAEQDTQHDRPSINASTSVAAVSSAASVQNEQDGSVTRDSAFNRRRASDSMSGVKDENTSRGGTEDAAEEVEELRTGSVDDAFTSQTGSRFTRLSRRPATSQGVLDTTPSSFSASFVSVDARHCRRTSDFGGLQTKLQEVDSANFFERAYDVNSAAHMCPQGNHSKARTEAIPAKSSLNDLRSSGQQHKYEHHELTVDGRVRRGSDVGPQTQKQTREQQQQQQQQQQQILLLSMLPDELGSRGGDGRYPSATVAHSSASHATSPSPTFCSPNPQQRMPIDYDGLNVRHGLWRAGEGVQHQHYSQGHGSPAVLYGADFNPLRSPPLVQQHVQRQLHHAGSFSQPEPHVAHVGAPLSLYNMRSTASGDGYGTGPSFYSGIGPRQQPDPYPVSGSYVRSPSSYAATNEFGMRIQPPNGFGHGGHTNPFPFPQRPHTFHDSGGATHSRLTLPQQIDLPENPYTRALFPASSSRQVSEFQRNGQLGGPALSPGMTVQETLQAKQRQQQQQQQQHQHQPSYLHFGPREPRQHPPLQSPQPGSQWLSRAQVQQASWVPSQDSRCGQAQQSQASSARPPPLPASIPLGFHPPCKQSSSQPQLAQQHSAHAVPDVGSSGYTAVSDRSSTSSYVSSAGVSDTRKTSAGEYQYRSSVDEPNTAPSSVLSSHSGPLQSSNGACSREHSASGGGGGPGGEQFGPHLSGEASTTDGSSDDDIDLSKIRPLPRPPVANVSSTVAAGSEGCESEGTLKAAQLSALLGSNDGEGTIKKSRSPGSATDSTSSSTVIADASEPMDVVGGSSRPKYVDGGTFCSFGSFDDDDDDNDGGTWAKPLDAIKPASEPSENSFDEGGTVRPSLTSMSPNGSTASPRRPELRLTIESPRLASPQSSAADSPHHLRPSPDGSSASPRTGSDVRLTPTGVHRSSSFARRGDNEWALRPPPEELYQNLDEFFPRHDLDKPVLDAVGIPTGQTGGFSPEGTPAAGFSSAWGVGAAVGSAAPAPTTFVTSTRHKKSIRRVAQDRMKIMESEEVNNPSDFTDLASTVRPTNRLAAAAGLAELTAANSATGGGAVAAVSMDGHHNDLVYKRSTRLWGTKLLEMTPGGVVRADQQQQHQQPPPSSSTSPLPSRPGAVTVTGASTSRDKPVFKWVKGDLIGKGTYGRVYIALNATTGEMIAVKQVEMPTTAFDLQDQRQRDVVNALKSEIDTLKDLDHPHIVSYLGFEETPEYLHLFLEYVPGGSIASVLRKYGKLEEVVIRFFVLQVLQGLNYLHESGVLHRDLKGDNILVNLDGTVKISDFGTMRRSEDIYADKQGMSLQGSVFWMAPEMVRNVHGYSAKVDIWSLGCLTLEMFAGRRPWSDDEALQAIFKIGMERRAPPIPPDVRLSPQADHFLRTCFTLESEKRPTAERLLQHVFPDVPPKWSFDETRLYRMMQRSLQNRTGERGRGS